MRIMKSRSRSSSSSSSSKFTSVAHMRRKPQVTIGSATINECRKMSAKCTCQKRRPCSGGGSAASTQISRLALAALMLHQLLHSGWPETGSPMSAEAVSVQRLQVPDLVVVDQLRLASQLAPPQSPPLSDRARFGLAATSGPVAYSHQQQPEAASLVVNSQQQMDSSQQQVTFECLVSFDRRRDRNLIVKWHHDERQEPIYQWIPELNKRSVAPQYRALIAPILSPSGGGLGGADALTPPTQHNLSLSAISHQGHQGPALNSTLAAAAAANQVQLLEAGFRLVRPTKELAGRYTCSAISSQNDDSKSKKMIVYTPPKSFRFNASRTDIGALLASQRDRLIQLSQPAVPPAHHQQQLLPLAYRATSASAAATTLSPLSQMYSTIDYVNVNQQRFARPTPPSAPPPPPPLGATYADHLQRQQQVMRGVGGVGGMARTPYGAAQSRGTAAPRLGLKLVCDIEQVFPVPEVSIFRVPPRAAFGSQQAAQPQTVGPPVGERLPKLETKIERDPYTGLFRVQVVSILDDDELANIRHNYLSAPAAAFGLAGGDLSPSAPPPPLELHFECVIALTNLELSRYADSRRSVVYRPDLQQQSPHERGHLDPDGRAQLAFGSSGAAESPTSLHSVNLLAATCALLCLLLSATSLLLPTVRLLQPPN